MMKIAIAKFNKIPSNNILVMPGVSKTGKGYLYKNPDIRKFQEDLINQLTPQFKDYKLPEKYYSVTLVFFLNKRFNSRDVSNMFKISEDAVKDVVKKDDSKYVNIHGYKRMSTDENEYILLIISPDVVVDIDNITKEFLGNIKWTSE